LGHISWAEVTSTPWHSEVESHINIINWAKATKSFEIQFLIQFFPTSQPDCAKALEKFRESPYVVAPKLKANLIIFPELGGW